MFFIMEVTRCGVLAVSVLQDRSGLGWLFKTKSRKR